jgi:hypothetical protein
MPPSRGGARIDRVKRRSGVPLIVSGLIIVFVLSASADAAAPPPVPPGSGPTALQITHAGSGPPNYERRKKRKKKRRRGTAVPAPAPGPASGSDPYATISGHSDWSSANVNVQHLDGGSWVNTPGGESLSDASGNYSHTVTAGFTYRYYVWFWYYMPFNYGGVIIQCHQLWADTSASVATVGGGIYPNLDTNPQPTGPIGC